MEPRLNKLSFYSPVLNVYRRTWCFQKVRYCTSGRALKVSVGMVVGCLLLGSMQLYLWTYNPVTESCTVRRSALAGGSRSLFSVWSWITEMLIFLAVPVIILIVNILVMREVRNHSLYTVSQKTSHLWFAITSTHMNGFRYFLAKMLPIK